ncbi:MAG: hypothetical protein ACI936_002449, partial [Paraglaciecola sp.]
MYDDAHLIFYPVNYLNNLKLGVINGRYSTKKFRLKHNKTT